MTRTCKTLFTLLPILLVLASCAGPRAQVSKTPGATLENYELVYLTYDSTWSAGHSVTRLLQQELERRGYAVKPAPTQEDQAIGRSAMTLHIGHAGDRKTAGKGRTDFLRHLDFHLKDSQGKRLADVSYSGGDLDRIEQKHLVRQIADDLFGPAS